MQFVWCAAQKVRRPNDGVQNLHIECGEELYAEVGTALALRDNSIRTSVRKVSSATDRKGSCRQGRDEPIWPPSPSNDPQLGHMGELEATFAVLLMKSTVKSG